MWIEMLCMHVHFLPIIKYIYNVFEFDSPWQFYFCHTVIFWVGPAQMISLWVNFIKNVVLLWFSFELTHFLYSHGVLRDDAQWRIISPVMQSGQCTISTGVLSHVMIMDSSIAPHIYFNFIKAWCWWVII